MDPITAFSVACGVIQVVDFGLQAAKKGREIYRDGSLSQNQHIEYATRNLNQASTSLEQSLKTLGTTKQHSKDDVELRNLAVDCQEASKDLLSELEGLKLDPKKPSKRQAVKKGIKSIWKKDRIEELQRKLEGYQKALDTRILIRLCQRFDASKIQQSDAFRDIGQAVQSLIVGLVNHKTTMHDLLVTENVATRDHITQKFDQLQLRLVSEDLRKRFLDSLYFAQITSREEQIPDAHKQTFQWIFDASGRALRNWDNFMQWLEKGNGVYWINGKAGSGKSTLMNYICADPRTDSALKIWAQHELLAIPKFFFWNAGDELQKSSVGLLRSLLYQILDHYPKLIATFVPPQEEHKPLAAWTERRLLSTLQEVVHQKEISVKICCFIDDLDEFDGSQTDLVDLIQKMAQDKNLKFCLSSRPLRPLEQAFQASAKLRLQDLTHADIEKYVVDKLQETPRMQQLQVQSSKLASSMIEEVVERADGVFLWVNLAVRELLEGFSNEDSEGQLQERLHSLPEKIEGFYVQMLSRVKRIYRAEAASFFQVILIEEMALLSLAFAEDQVLGYEKIQYATGLRPGDITSRCDSMQIRLSTRCAGLLECTEISEQLEDVWYTSEQFEDVWDTSEQFEDVSDTSEPFKDLSYSSVLIEDQTTPESLAIKVELQCYRGMFVRFLHRTARDFLLETEIGKAAMNTNTDSAFNPYIWHFWAQLMPYYVRLRWSYGLIKGQLEDLGSRQTKIMKYAFLAEHKAGKPQKELMKTLDLTIAKVYSWTEDCHPSDKCKHWSAKIQYFMNYGGFHSCCDFLGFAAYHCLRYFVLDALGPSQHGKNQPDISYLLGCALANPPRPDGEYSRRYFELITSLLERGADPNTIVETGSMEPYHNYSAFEVFLENLWSARLYEISLLATEWAMVAEVLLANGADVHLTTERCFSEIITFSNRYFIILYLEMSMASLMKACLKNSHGWEKIEAILQARGAQESQRIIFIYEDNPVRRPRANIVFRQGAEAQAEYLLEAYVRYFVDRTKRLKEELKSAVREVYPYLVDLDTGEPPDWYGSITTSDDEDQFPSSPLSLLLTDATEDANHKSESG